MPAARHNTCGNSQARNQQSSNRSYPAARFAARCALLLLSLGIYYIPVIYYAETGLVAMALQVLCLQVQQHVTSTAVNIFLVLRHTHPGCEFCHLSTAETQGR